MYAACERSGGQWGIDAIAQMSKQVPALLRHTCDVATSTACCAWFCGSPCCWAGIQARRKGRAHPSSHLPHKTGSWLLPAHTPAVLPTPNCHHHCHRHQLNSDTHTRTPLTPTPCRGSPTSQKVSFEQLRRGAGMDLGECLQMENRMVRPARWLPRRQTPRGPQRPRRATLRAASGRRRQRLAPTESRRGMLPVPPAKPAFPACPAPLQVHRCVMNTASDFYEGVQAALIRRSGDPRWEPASLKDVSRQCLSQEALLHS